jgi:hypothetical protein
MGKTATTGIRQGSEEKMASLFSTQAIQKGLRRKQRGLSARFAETRLPTKPRAKIEKNE